MICNIFCLEKHKWHKSSSSWSHHSPNNQWCWEAALVGSRLFCAWSFTAGTSSAGKPWTDTGVLLWKCSAPALTAKVKTQPSSKRAFPHRTPFGCSSPCGYAANGFDLKHI